MLRQVEQKKKTFIPKAAVVEMPTRLEVAVRNIKEQVRDLDHEL